ncbi:MAG: HAD-IA family hydrolase [Erysipelotrichaceae bacterium]|nr:HAD-IA family hydrolase [Erysipelotrichaceae bacterium]
MNNILFDLDGTLTDPFLGICSAVNYSLKYFHKEEEHLEDLKKFIGPPLDVSYREYYHMNDNEIEIAIKKYREYFGDIGLFENEVYEGIEEMLQTLIDYHKNLYICTSKPYEYTIRILEHFHLDSYFKGIYGATMSGSRKYKKDVISYCIDKENLDYRDCIMVGDRYHDIEGAHENNIACVGVLYGYGYIEEFKEYQCDYIVENIQELTQLLLEGE